MMKLPMIVTTNLSRLPHGRRGLKFNSHYASRSMMASPPAWEAGIEITKVAMVNRTIKRSPPAWEAGIEICYVLL